MTQTNQPNQPPIPPQVKSVVFDFEFVQQLANYLGRQPYQEVAPFIGKIQEIVQTAQAELNPKQPDKEPKE